MATTPDAGTLIPPDAGRDVTARRLLLGLISAVVACGGKPPLPESSAFTLDATSCRACHQKIFDSYSLTAHFNTSAPANARSVKGSFVEGTNVLRTRVKSIAFKMEGRQDALYQTASDLDHLSSRSERFDLVVGSGRKGQSYLYWRNGLLFQLPVSYLTGLNQWINSPGYLDGQVDFERVIGPRCLECHSTTFQLEESAGAARYASGYRLGISCEKCHGDSRRHVEYHSSNPAAAQGEHLSNPARFDRDRQLDNCGLCHSGGRKPSLPPFSYRPGLKLDDFFVPQSDSEVAVADVHGNQIGLLRRSKCFRSSPSMSCSTCHDVHQPQRDLTQLAQRCLTCHQTTQHKIAAEMGVQTISACIDCHMPDQRSNAIHINTATEEFSPSYRSHLIAVYPEVTARILRSRQHARR